jgi:hypothetical protein
MKLRNKTLTCLCLAMLANVASSAQPTARGGVPQVLTPPPETPIDRGESTIRRFRAANAAGKPTRIAVFWNRALSDQLSTSREDFVRTRETTQSGNTEESEASRTQVGDTHYRQQDASSSREEEVTRGTRATGTEPRPGLKEPQDWEVRAAFEGALLEGGALLVDRNLTMRTTSVGSRDFGDAQQVETSALLGKADLLLEVLVTVDANSPSGLLFLVTAKRIADGSLVASLMTAATRPQEASRFYVAGPGGFQRAQAPPLSLRDAGRELALETMHALIGRGDSHD